MKIKLKVKDPNYPECPICNEEMELDILLQADGIVGEKVYKDFTAM